MVRFAVTGALAALLALTGCGGAQQEREKKEQEAAAAEKKLADSRAFLERLEREKKLLATKLAESNTQLAESRGKLRRTLAGAAYLAAEQESGGLVLDVDMAAARDGFLLAEAARAKDHEAVSELAVRVLDDQRPCVRKPTEEEEPTEACPPCEVAPYEDACVGVETNRSSSPDWSCTTLARTGEGLPPTAFCTSVFQHPASTDNVVSSYSERELDTSLQVVRVAFAHNGQLQVSDYPPPYFSLYNPPNVAPLVRCGAETARNRCIHDCQESHGRYEDPCACAEPSPEPVEDGETEESFVEEEESDEVRQAREAAEAAEEEAAAAQERVAAAQRELQYQECLSSCEAGDTVEEAESGEALPQPTASVVSVRLESTPAPGIFVVSRELKVLGARQEVVESSSLTLVLRNPGLVALWKKKAPPARGTGEAGRGGQAGRRHHRGGQGRAALSARRGGHGPGGAVGGAGEGLCLHGAARPGAGGGAGARGRLRGRARRAEALPAGRPECLRRAGSGSHGGGGRRDTRGSGGRRSSREPHGCGLGGGGAMKRLWMTLVMGFFLAGCEGGHAGRRAASEWKPPRVSSASWRRRRRRCPVTWTGCASG